MSKQEFENLVGECSGRASRARSTARKARWLLLAIFLHLRERKSYQEFVINHATDVCNLLLPPDHRVRVLHMLAEYPATIEEYIVSRYEIRPEEAEFEAALRYVHPLRSHRHPHHIPYSGCLDCFGSMVTVALAGAISAGAVPVESVSRLRI